ncbi:hypothetical protein RD055328_12980 [Companilactobacillus sp. RD055328]|uniref:hypothetical protein n=1 Tax=Companilactobacillus sp. RD055328 TaxID=2916634 RepID=UPI001FC8256B|nr:hypothetical protein [Companilactobacillus sp. RD055328]GKQ43375.1 hypothetical protein RD055328_12980 [Companilactobacillus sp. RD055328]
MKKYILGVIVMIGFWNSLITPKISEGAIYTGKPEISDAYYAPFKNDLRSFSKDMQSKKLNMEIYGFVMLRQ